MAQGNGYIHPHIAPKSISFTPLPGARSGYLDLDFRAGSNAWQRGDAIFPNGAVVPPNPAQPTGGPAHPGNHGGFKSFHDGSLLTLSCVFDTTARIPSLMMGPGWHQVTIRGQTMRRFLGHLRPPNVPLPVFGGQPYVDDAAFELFAPTTPYNGEKKVVFFLIARGTLASPKAHDPTTIFSPPLEHSPSRDDRHLYPGRFSRDGLHRDEDISSVAALGPTQFDPDTPPTIRGRLYSDFFGGTAYARCNAADIYPILGRITYSFPNRQTTFEMQRLLEFERAVSLILTDPASTFRLPEMTTPLGSFSTVAFGGSNGGANAAALPLYWPDRFHAAGAMVYPPSLRRELGEHAFWEMTKGMSGFDESGMAYLLGDALQWNMLPAMKSVVDGLHATPGARYSQWDQSYLRRLKDGTMPRPVCFIPGDEDATTTGTDWAAEVSGSWARRATATIGTSGPVLAYSIADNRCHESGPWEHPLGAVAGQLSVGDDQLLPELGMLAEAQRTSGANPPPILNIPEGGQRGLTPDDVYDPILAHSPWLTSPAAGGSLPANSMPSSPGYLQRSVPAAGQQQWKDELGNPGKLAGAGTWLGRDDTMIIRQGSVFVGSADGVVSRYKVDHADPRRPFVLEAQSPVLGRWISGLTEGPFGGQNRIVCATYGHVFLLDPLDLSVQEHVEVAFDAFWPRRIVLADVDASVAGNEIVCPTYNGGILVLRDGGTAGPVERLHWPEPGVSDMVEVGGYLMLLSHRGVLARVGLSKDMTGAVRAFPSGTYVGPDDAVNAGSSIALLHAASAAQSGIPLDMEDLNVVEPPAVIALYGNNADHEASLRRFDTASGALSVARWNVEPNASTDRLDSDGSGRMRDIETARFTGPPSDEGSDEDGRPGDHIVLLNRGTLYLFDADLQLRGARHLGGFAPARQAVDIAVGDFVDGPTVNGYDDEVVIATQGGRLVWVPVGGLIGGTAAAPLQLSATDPNYSSTSRQSYWTPTPPANPVEFRSNRSTAAWWGLVVDGMEVHGFDQQWSHWQLATDGTGLAVVDQVPVSPVKGAELTPPVTAPVTPPLQGTESATFGGPFGPFSLVEAWAQVPTWTFRAWALQSFPDYPADPGNRFMEPPPTFAWANESSMFQGITDRFAVFRQPGDTWFDASTLAVHWWSGGDNLIVPGAGPVRFANLMEGMVGEVLPSGELRQMQRIWASTRPQHLNPTFPMDLRSMDYGLSPSDLQAVKILNGDPNTVLIGTPGADLVVIDPRLTMPDPLSPLTPGRETSSPTRVAISTDLGHGIASVTQAPTGASGITDVFAVVALDHQPPDPFSLAIGAPPQSMAGALHHYRYSPGTGSSSASLQPAPQGKRRLDAAMIAQANAPGVIPVGVFYGDVISTNPGDEVLVAGMFGEVVVFGFSGGALSSQPLQVLRLEGCVGLHGAIRQTGSSIILAGSQGTWRLDPQ